MQKIVWRKEREERKLIKEHQRLSKNNAIIIISNKLTPIFINLNYPIKQLFT